MNVGTYSHTVISKEKVTLTLDAEQSGLTRLPGDARVAPADALRLLEERSGRRRSSMPGPFVRLRPSWLSPVWWEVRPTTG